VIFKQVELDWGDQTYTIPPNRILGAIAIIEEYFTFQDLADAVNSKKLSLTTLSRTYGDILRYAGASVSDDEVYAGMFAGDLSSQIRRAVETLLVMMIPPSVFAAAAADTVEAPARGNARAPRGRNKEKPSGAHIKR